LYHLTGLEGTFDANQVVCKIIDWKRLKLHVRLTIRSAANHFRLLQGPNSRSHQRIVWILYDCGLTEVVLHIRIRPRKRMLFGTYKFFLALTKNSLVYKLNSMRRNRRIVRTGCTLAFLTDKGRLGLLVHVTCILVNPAYW